MNNKKELSDPTPTSNKVAKQQNNQHSFSSQGRYHVRKQAKQNNSRGLSFSLCTPLVTPGNKLKVPNELCSKAFRRFFRDHTDVTQWVTKSNESNCRDGSHDCYELTFDAQGDIWRTVGDLRLPIAKPKQPMTHWWTMVPSSSQDDNQKPDHWAHDLG